MVRLDVHSLKDLLEAFPAPAVMRAGGHWLANQGACRLISAGRDTGNSLHFEEWLATQQPEQEGRLLQLMDKLSQNGIDTADATFHTSEGGTRTVEIRYLPGQGADMWLLADHSEYYGQLTQLQERNNQLEAQLNQKLEELSKAINILLRTRYALREDRRLLERIAEKLQVPMHRLEEWCDQSEED